MRHYPYLCIRSVVVPLSPRDLASFNLSASSRNPFIGSCISPAFQGFVHLLTDTSEGLRLHLLSQNHAPVRDVVYVSRISIMLVCAPSVLEQIDNEYEVFY